MDEIPDPSTAEFKQLKVADIRKYLKNLNAEFKSTDKKTTLLNKLKKAIFGAANAHPSPSKKSGASPSASPTKKSETSSPAKKSSNPSPKKSSRDQEDKPKRIYIFKEHHSEMTTNHLPHLESLGKLSNTRVQQALDLLDEIEKFINKNHDNLHDRKVTVALVDFSNKFYTLVPHYFPSSKHSAPLLDNITIITAKRKALHDHTIPKNAEENNNNNNNNNNHNSNPEAAPADSEPKSELSDLHPQGPVPSLYISQNWERVEPSISDCETLGVDHVSPQHLEPDCCPELPLGKLSKSQLEKGKSTLEELANHLDEVSQGKTSLSRQTLIKLTNRFYTLIPHVFHSRHTVPLLDSLQLVKRNIHQMDDALEHPNHQQTHAHEHESQTDSAPSGEIPKSYLSQDWELIESDLALLDEDEPDLHGSTEKKFKAEAQKD